MTQEHPITPPPELVKRWTDNAHLSQPNMGAICHEVATQAASWGADQELKACCEWLETYVQRWAEWSAEFRADRRPKPPSLKEQAIEILDDIDTQLDAVHYNILRRALETLSD